MVKPRLYDENCDTKVAALWTLNKVLGDSLKLLHPTMPFITEEIYGKLYNDGKSIMISKWPKYSDKIHFEKEENQIEELKEVIVGIRNLRTNINAHPSKKTKLIFVTKQGRKMLQNTDGIIKKLGFSNEIEIQEEKTNIPQNAMSVLTSNMEVFIPFEDLVDLEVERERLKGEIKKLESEVQRGQKMLSNPGFVNKAPAQKIEEEKQKLAKYEEQLKANKERLKSIN